MVLSSEQDAFFKANMYENFGDIGMNIKRMVDDFQQVAKSNQNIQTVGTNIAFLKLCYGKTFMSQTLELMTLTPIIYECVNFTEDMARFVDNYPEYRKMQGNVSKHVTLVTEMSKLVEARKLMTVSQTEQDLACNGGQGAAYEVVKICAYTH